MPSNMDYVSANKASRAAADWAAKKREKVERAAALRMERARAAQEAEARAAAGEDLTSDPSPVDQGPPVWWEDADRAKQVPRERQAQPRPSSREARRGPYHVSDAPSRDSGDRRHHHHQQQQQQRQRRQWNKAPDPQEWQPVADSSNGAGQPGEVLWRRPQEEWQDHRPPRSHQEPQFNLDFDAQESREEAQEREGGGAEEMDEATAAWLAMLRPDEPVAPPPPAPKPKAKKAARKPSQKQQQQEEEEQDEATKAWMGMLRADAAPNPRAGGRGAGRPYGGNQQAAAGRYVADTYADDSDDEESCHYYAGRGADLPQASPPQQRRRPQQQPQQQPQRQPLRKASSWGGEDPSEDPAAAAAGNGFHLPPVGGGRRHWGEHQGQGRKSGGSSGSSGSSAGVRARSPQEWGAAAAAAAGGGGAGVPIERRQRRPSSGPIQRADVLILDPHGNEHQLERGGGGADRLPPRPKRLTSKGEEQFLEAAGAADSSEALSRRRRTSDHEDEAAAAAPLSSRRRSGTRSPSPSTPEALLLQQQRRQRREEEPQDVGAPGRPRPLEDRRRTSASPGPRSPSPQSPVVSASGSRAPSPGAPKSAGRRAAAPQSSPPRPEWVDDLSEPAREVVSQQDYDSRPIGRSRAAAPAAAAAKPSPAPALEIPFGKAAEDDPWHRGARVRKHKDSKSSAVHGGRKPIRAPLNPEIAGKPVSPKHARKPMRDKLAPLRKAPGGGGVHKVVGNKKDDDPCTRQMVDKRQSRKDNAPSFKAAIESYKTGMTDIPARLGKGMAIKASQGLMPRNDGLGVPVYVRKRPLFAHEVKKNEYDVVAVDAEDMVVVHNCQMHADLKRMHIVHKAFPCAHAFDEHCTNDDVYDVAAAQLVESAVFGGQGAIFMYGQTGSGKTHTMSSIESLGLHQIFSDLRAQGGAAEVRIAIFEIAGNKCFDLLQGGHKQIVLKESEGGAVELMGAKEPAVLGPEEALNLVAEAKSRRATASTAANATSSRSHCVTRVTVWCEAFGQGQLTLVDCAGSERNNDSMYHDAQARKESAEINASLYALRECIRLRRRQAEEAQQPNGGKHVHVPYRSSQLTRVLMECFTSSDAAVAVIATVSPSSTDTEHSMSTLQTVLMMSGASKDAFAEVKQDVQLAGIQKPPEVRLVKPINWTAEDVREWLQGLKRGAFREYAYGLPGDINGRALVRMNKAAIAQICAGGQSSAGLVIFNALRNEIDRVDAELRRQRKGIVEMNARLKGGW